jgi:hypothetical protein
VRSVPAWHGGVGSVQAGRSGLVGRGAARLGKALSGVVWPGETGPAQDWQGMARCGGALIGLVWSGAARHG